MYFCIFIFFKTKKLLSPNSPSAFILLSGVVLVSIKDISGDGIDIAYGDRPRVQGVSPMVSLYLPHSVYQLCPGCCGPHCPVIIHWAEAGGLTIVLFLPSKENLLDEGMMQEECRVARGRHCTHGTTHPRMHAIVK